MDKKVVLFAQHLEEIKKSNKNCAKIMLRGACDAIGPGTIKSIEGHCIAPNESDYVVVFEDSKVSMFFVSDIVAITY